MIILPFVIEQNLDTATVESVDDVPKIISLQYIVDVAKSHGISTHILESNSSTIFQEPDDLMSGVNVVFTFHDGLRAFVDIPCQFYLAKKSAFLASLQPVKDIAQAVDDIMSTYFADKIMVGIHIRTHDAKYDWAVIPPRSPMDDDGRPATALEFGTGASINDFIRVLAGIHARFGLLARFFIASNDMNMKNTILTAYPTSLALDVPYNRHNVEGMRSALVEWLLLTRASLLVNTYGSTFAVEAALVHMRPIIGIYHSYLIHHTDIRLPFCGLPLFMAANNNIGVRGTYTEGTVDDRQIDNVFLAFKPCTLLAEWGFEGREDIYCSVIT